MTGLPKLGLYSLSLIPGLLAIVGNLQGGIASFLASGFMILLIIPDWLFQDSQNSPKPSNPRLFQAILQAQVLTHTLSVFSLIYGIYAGILDDWYILAATISTGMASGQGALVTAHELIHQVRSKLRFTGLWLLFLHSYTNYYIEHIQGHHKNVGLAKDPTTATLGESFYHFLIRIVPQQFFTALDIEANRLRKQHQAPYGPTNLIVAALTLKLVLLILGLYYLGWMAVLAYLGQCLVARFLYETGSYVQHYGLTRNPQEQIRPQHSWENHSVIGRYLLLDIVRHADHHHHVLRPYQELQATPALKLPASSFGLLGIVLIPPAWFAIAHSRLSQKPN